MRSRVPGHRRELEQHCCPLGQTCLFPGEVSAPIEGPLGEAPVLSVCLPDLARPEMQQRARHGWQLSSGDGSSRTPGPCHVPGKAFLCHLCRGGLSSVLLPASLVIGDPRKGGSLLRGTSKFDPAPVLSLWSRRGQPLRGLNTSRRMDRHEFSRPVS